MKLISWNCQGAFRNKVDAILAHKPDILVVQECECPDKLKIKASSQPPNDIFWYGDTLHKGIGIFSFLEYKFELLPEFNPVFRYVIPLRVTGYGKTFTLFAIWAMSCKENYEARYIGQVWLAINHYANQLSSSTILIGDFNSNKIWDKKSRVGNHSKVVNFLANYNIYSTYHQYFKLEHGKEEHPTFFLQRNEIKSYHIDYCFLSTDFISTTNIIEIGGYHDWKQYSDHSPLIINV